MKTNKGLVCGFFIIFLMVIIIIVLIKVNYQTEIMIDILTIAAILICAALLAAAWSRVLTRKDK